MPRQKEMNFSKILFNGVSMRKEKAPTANIGKNGQMLISRSAVQKYGLMDCFIEIDRYDPEKRALGWRKVPALSKGDWTKTTRLCKTDKLTGGVRLSVGRILTALDVPKFNYKRLEIKMYEDTMERQTIYWVSIPKVKDEERK